MQEPEYLYIKTRDGIFKQCVVDMSLISNVGVLGFIRFKIVDLINKK